MARYNKRGVDVKAAVDRARLRMGMFEAVAGMKGPQLIICEGSTHEIEIPTEREQEILRLVAAGCTNDEIGRRLILSPETVKSHVRHILAKLNARSRTHAVAIAFDVGLLVPGEDRGGGA